MGGKDHEINIEDPYESLVSWITKNELEKVRPRSSTTCIYKVRDELRRANEAAYTPKVVSIGPMHHEKSLNIIKDHKRRFLKRFLQRTKKDLTHYVKIVKDSEKRLRDCYQETFEFSSDEFCHIILVDAVFIVELFVSLYHNHHLIGVHLQLPDEREWLPYATKVFKETSFDFLLIENQLPFFILEEFWKDACSTTESIVQFFSSIFQSLVWDLEEKQGTNVDKKMPMHFVDLVRKLHVPRNPMSDPQKSKIHQVPNATELHQAGIKFRVGSSKNLFDISFCNGVLEIPKLRIVYQTELIMRNLVAFEQSHYEEEETYISQYLCMLDYLVNTDNDVDLLIKNQILENSWGDNNNVSAMINKLCAGLIIKRKYNYFDDIFEKLDRHYRKRWNKWKASLKQNYFNTPWATISFVAAFILLVLTIIQTIGTIITWIKK